jgi:hypothetical protein
VQAIRRFWARSVLNKITLLMSFHQLSLAVQFVRHFCGQALLEGDFPGRVVGVAFALSHIEFLLRRFLMR